MRVDLGRFRLFISYRRADSRSDAFAIYREFKQVFSDDVFIDEYRIEGGERWPARLQDEVELATVMVCVIGPSWTGASPDYPSVRARIHDPDDWVRCEVARALERGITLLPLLVEGVSLPEASELPAELHGMLGFQALPLRARDWDADVERILDALRSSEELPKGEPDESATANPPLLSGLFLPADVRNYLRDLAARLQARNAGTAGQYVNLEAEERERPEPRREYPRQLGHVLSLPRVRPILAEVPRSMGVATSSDIVGLDMRTVRSALAALRSHQDPLVLLGEPGSGKSTTLRELAIQLARRALRFPGAPVPIYVELGRFRQRVDRDPERAIVELVRRAIPDGASSLRRHLLGRDITTPVVILFDAMDEMPRRGDHALRTAALASFASEYAVVARCVFACRTNDFDPGFGHRQLVLRSFDESRIRLFLRKTLGRSFVVEGRRETPRSIARRLMQADELGSEAGNPLTLSLGADFLVEHGRWPRGRAELFQNHLAALAAKALHRRDHGSPRAEQIVETVDAWATLAFEIFSRAGSVFIARAAIAARAEALGLGLAIGGGLILEEPGSGQLRFRHHRLQEYLVARRLHLPEPPLPDWPAVLGSPRWQETLLNYFAIGGRDERAVGVIARELEPARDYFAKLRTIVERAEADLESARIASNAILPDEKVVFEGSDGYSPAQRARKDAAEAVVAHRRARVARLRTLPPQREGDWAEKTQLAARVAGVIPPDSESSARLRAVLQATLSGIVDFGRPAGQVRMASAWRDVADWCSVALLDPLRESRLQWVESQAIHARVSTPFGGDRADQAFAEELERETLGLGLLRQLRVFLETAGLQPGRRWQLGAAVCSQVLFVAAVSAVVVCTAMAVALVASEISTTVGWLVRSLTEAGWPTVLTGWILLTAVLVVLVPGGKMSATRAAVANALLGGLVLGRLRYLDLESQRGLDGWQSWSALSVSAWAAAPSLLSAAACFVAMLATVAILRVAVAQRGFGALGKAAMSSRLGTITGGFTMAGVAVLLAGGAADLFSTTVGVYVMLATTFLVFWTPIVLFLVVLFGAYKEGEVLELIVPIGIACAFFGVSVGILAVLNMLLAILPGWLQSFLGALFETTFVLLYLLMGVILVSAYIYLRFRDTFREVRYRIFRRSIQRRGFDGTLDEWVERFQNSSPFDRRELLETLDPAAIGAGAEDALRALHGLEAQVEEDSPVANLFHQTMYKLQEEVRQQRWSIPEADSPDATAAANRAQEETHD